MTSMSFHFHIIKQIFACISSAVKNECTTRIQKHKQKFAENKNLTGQLDNCLVELTTDKEEDYSSFFESFANKISVNWRDIFTEL